MTARPPSARPPSAGAGSAARSSPAASGVVTLFTVLFRHAYYNLQDERCPDFTVAPTPDCAALIGRLGITTRIGADGFRVCAPQSRLPAIADAIRRGAADGQGFWTRLTYSLVLRNPAFYGITALPLDTSPASRGLYASNLDTRKVRGDRLFGGSGGAGVTLVPVTGATLSVPAPDGTVVTASDIAGQPVRSVTVTAGQPPVLSLAGLPCDLYTITATASYDGPSSVLYTPTRPPSAGLLDLLLAQPADGAGTPAAFPFDRQGLSAGTAAPTVRPVTLTLSFKARRTVWSYFVVALNPQSRRVADLSISGDGATFRPAAAPVTLPTGETATLFQSSGALDLRERTPYRFALSGQSQGSDGGRDRISVNPLPGAPAQPVWPASTGNGLSGSSEIFVYV